MGGGCSSSSSSSSSVSQSVSAPPLNTSTIMAPTVAALSTRHKLRKPLVEKMRRDRINSCIEQLKELLEAEFHRQDPNGKLEKADVLEMTVAFLKQQLQPEGAGGLGYSRCWKETLHFLSATSLSEAAPPSPPRRPLAGPSPPGRPLTEPSPPRRPLAGPSPPLTGPSPPRRPLTEPSPPRRPLTGPSPAPPSYSHVQAAGKQLSPHRGVWRPW